MSTPLNREVPLTHAQGLHARPCLAIVKLANQYQSRLQVRHGHRSADARNILDLLSLGAPGGSQLHLSADGPDAPQALDALADLIAKNFGMDGEA